MYSLDQTAKSAAANSTDDIIVVAIARRHQMFIYIILHYLAVIPNRTTSPATLHRRELGIALLTTIKDGAPALWQRLFRMTKPSFDTLCGWLIENTIFRRSREILECEKLFIFLFIVCQGVPQNTVAHLFGYSNETINRLVKLGIGKEYKEINKFIYVEYSIKC